jgi:hypothetical protein
MNQEQKLKKAKRRKPIKQALPSNMIKAFFAMARLK